MIGAVSLRNLSSGIDSEHSSSICTRVQRARAIQTRRMRRTNASCNAHVSGLWLDRNTSIEGAARNLLQTAAEKLGLSARGYHRVLKVARTIADIDEDKTILPRHVAEALRYRPSGGDSHATFEKPKLA
jgi:magnesium chelatase family protein